MTVTQRWQALTPAVRRSVVLGGSAEAVLKAVALVDLARRPAQQVRGSRARWAVAIVLLNSVGAVPLAYLLRGRRPG